MRFDTLADWLAWQETLHPSRIEMKLERIRGVWAGLAPGSDPGRLPMPVITVGGTNGKGSCVAYLEAIYRAAGYRTGAYTSPHLLRYNERVRVDGAVALDTLLCDAFARIDAARGETLLTYFEFGTLAALDLFVRANVDVAILEVGLGGRLDATNIIDADVAVVTSIGRDHTAWLGDTPDQIAVEKAGIFRTCRPAVIGSRDAPPRLRERAEELGARPLQLGREFDWLARPDGWTWRGPGGAARTALPPPALRGVFQYDNAAAALAAAHCLADRLPLPAAAVRQGLQRVRLDGRFMVRPGATPGGPTWVLDVAHNAPAALALAGNLAALACRGRRLAVLSVLADKDAAAIAAALSPQIDEWHLAPAPGERALPLVELDAAVLAAAPKSPPVLHADIGAALAAAARAGPDDAVLVFGSFLTVEAALRSPWVGSV